MTYTLTLKIQNGYETIYKIKRCPLNDMNQLVNVFSIFEHLGVNLKKILKKLEERSKKEIEEIGGIDKNENWFAK